MSDVKIRDVIIKNMEKIVMESLLLPRGWEKEVYINKEGGLEFSIPLRSGEFCRDQQGLIGKIQSCDLRGYSVEEDLLNNMIKWGWFDEELLEFPVKKFIELIYEDP